MSLANLLPDSKQAGPPLIATAGQDGGVRVWDARQPDAPAAAFLPAPGAAAHDAWCVAVGNAHSEGQACVLAGYAGGELRLLDLAGGRVRWGANVGIGVCGVQARTWGGRRLCAHRGGLPVLLLATACPWRPGKPSWEPTRLPTSPSNHTLFPRSLSVQFDRRAIPMNKLVVTCLESRLCLYDARTQHPTEGFAGSW